MDLQNQQLSELSDWLAKTEKRTAKMESEPLGPDLESLKKQVEEHKVNCSFQEPHYFLAFLCVNVSTVLCKSNIYVK